MPRNAERRYRVLTGFQKHFYNKVLRTFSSQPVLETIGRTSGLPRVVPVSGRRIGNDFWFVSEFGERSDYVRNIQANPHVRTRLRGTWHTGIAELLVNDDPHQRLTSLPKLPSMAVRAAGTDLLTVRVTLDQ